MYLCDLIPPSIQSTTVYPLRNGSDIIMPFGRLSNTYDSFIPSTIRQSIIPYFTSIFKNWSDIN
jgi:hypothetical protein